MIKHKKLLAILALFLGVGFATFSSTSASALTIEDKSIYEGLVTCYGSNGFRSPIRLDEYQYSSSDYYKNLSIISDAGNSKSLPLINGYYSVNSTNCTGILIGNARGSFESGNLFGGLKSIGGLSPADPDNYGTNQAAYTEAVTNFMDTMGYDAGTAEREVNTTKKCFALPYSDTIITDYSIIDMGAKYTNYGCFLFDKDNKLKGITTEPYANADQTFDMAWFEAVDGPHEYGDIGLKLTAKYCVLGGGMCTTNSHTYWYNNDGNYDMTAIRNDWYAKITEGGFNAAYSYMSVYYPGKPQDIPDVIDYKDVASNYTLRSGTPEYGQNVMQKVSDYGQLAFNPEEEISLYQHYIKNYYKASIKGCYTDENSISYFANQEGYKNRYTITDGTGKTLTCLVSDPTEHKNDEVNGLNNDKHFKDKKLSFSQLMSALDGSTTSETISEGAAPSTPGGPSATGDSSKSCYNSTSLGWVLCPILDTMTKAVEKMYNVIEDDLELDTKLIGSTAEESGTFQGWKAFQNIANVAVIALLLIVIFSQVTGIGIDNYGIKKTLPKIIMAAVLVNLSFIICQAAADLSNVLGYNLKTMLESFAGDVDANYHIDNFSRNVNSALTGLAAGSALAIAGFTWATWLPALFLGVVGLLISIVFFFIIVEVRKALLVIAIVIAPLAIASYMLPNTKKWFDKWFKIFTAMLLVFPACGLAMGAGKYMSSLLIATGGEGESANFFFHLVAILMNVIPFFVVPTLVKNSMAGIAGIGGKLSGIGKKAGGLAKTGIRSTGAYKDIQQQMNRTNDRQRAAFMRLRPKALQTAGYKRRLGAINQRIAAVDAANSKNDTWSSDERMRANADALDLKEKEEAIGDVLTSLKARGRYDDGTVLDLEDGEQMYLQAKKARKNNNHKLADAIIDLAGQSGKTATQFQETMLKDTGHALSKETATRMMTGSGSKMFRNASGIGYQYAREVYNGKAAAKGQSSVDVWQADIKNIAASIEKNINNPEAYAGQGKETLTILNNRKADLAAYELATTGKTTLTTELEYAAAEAAANNKDSSKAGLYETMRTIYGGGGALRETHDVEAQQTQTAAQIAAQATAATAQATATANAARQQFESSHVTNAELKRAHAPKGKKPTYYEAPEGFTHIGGQIYQDGTGRKYDASKNKFFS